MSEQLPISRIQQVFLTRNTGEQEHARFGPVFRPVPTREPGVLQRLIPEGEDPPSQVITAFAPAAVRPGSYPTALPFVPGVPTWTTEYSGGEQPPGARWNAGDQTAPLVEALIEQSIETGWSRTDTAVVLPSHLPLQQIVLRQGEWTRLVIAADFGAVQLLHLPAHLLESRPEPRAQRADGSSP